MTPSSRKFAFAFGCAAVVGQVVVSAVYVRRAYRLGREEGEADGRRRELAGAAPEYSPAPPTEIASAFDLELRADDQWASVARTFPIADATSFHVDFESPPPSKEAPAPGTEMSHFAVSLAALRKDRTVLLASAFGGDEAWPEVSLPIVRSRTLRKNETPASPADVRARVDGDRVVIEVRHPAVPGVYRVKVTSRSLAAPLRPIVDCRALDTCEPRNAQTR